MWLMRIMRLYILLISCLLTVTAAHGTETPDSASLLPLEFKASLITFFPGSEVFELYGHTDLRIQASDGTDMIFNYGVFDFTSEHFFYRFVKGETDYMCEAYPTRYLKQGYEGRRMVEQDLNLSNDQIREMCAFLVLNAQPMYRNYRYKYFSDNCSTRPLNVIENFLGEKISFADDGEQVTFRDVIHRYTRNYAWEEFGIDLLIGLDADTVITQRQKMFVPMILMDALRNVSIVRDGKQMKLVSGERVINDGAPEGLILPLTPWWMSPMAVFLLLLAVVAVISALDIKKRHCSRWLDTALWTAATIVGLLVWYTTFVSVHEATSPNVNVLWLHPFYVLPLVMMFVKRGNRWRRLYHAANLLVLAVALVQWPLSGQVPNLAFFTIILSLMLRDIVSLTHLRTTK